MSHWQNNLSKSPLLVGIAFALGIAACSSSNGANSGSTKPITTDNNDAGSLPTCDGAHETSAAPITSACGSFITPTGTTVKLGPYGAKMDVNVGKGFENTDPVDNATCPGFAGIFKEDQNQTNQLLDVGPQPCNAGDPNTGNCLDFKLYSTYYPAHWPNGQIPVITWGNGTCAQPEGYGTLLRYVASYGFFIIAANSREVGKPNAADAGASEPMLQALDFAAAANADSTSPYYGHLDMSRVGAMGHSQGGGATVAASADDRVKSVIIWNAALSAPKPFLAVSGDLDVTGFSADQMATAVAGQSKGAYLFYHNPAGTPADMLKGHLVLMLTPERVEDQGASWWQMIFDDDAAAKAKFVGEGCAFCDHPSDYNYGENGL